MENLAPQDRVVLAMSNALLVGVRVGFGATAAFDAETEAESSASVLTGVDEAIVYGGLDRVVAVPGRGAGDGGG